MHTFLEATVKAIHACATTAHVEIELKGEGVIPASVTIEASITIESVAELDLKNGSQAYPVIKASDVMVAVK